MQATRVALVVVRADRHVAQALFRKDLRDTRLHGLLHTGVQVLCMRCRGVDFRRRRIACAVKFRRTSACQKLHGAPQFLVQELSWATPLHERRQFHGLRFTARQNTDIALPHHVRHIGQHNGDAHAGAQPQGPVPPAKRFLPGEESRTLLGLGSLRKIEVPVALGRMVGRRNAIAKAAVQKAQMLQRVTAVLDFQDQLFCLARFLSDQPLSHQALLEAKPGVLKAVMAQLRAGDAPDEQLLKFQDEIHPPWVALDGAEQPRGLQEPLHLSGKPQGERHSQSPQSVQWTSSNRVAGFRLASQPVCRIAPMRQRTPANYRLLTMWPGPWWLALPDSDSSLPAHPGMWPYLWADCHCSQTRERRH